MFIKISPILLLCLFSIPEVTAQSGTLSVGPLLTCGLTTFTCPGTSGCCTIGGCCGSGCCANGYACINEGTADEACCDSFDPTKCGTAPSPSSSPDTGGSSGNNQCVGVHACPAIGADGVGWTCFFGETCGFSYRACNPCPYLGNGGGSAPTSSFDGASPTSSDSSDESSPTSSSSDESLPSSSSGSDTSPTPSKSSPGSTTSSKTPGNSGTRTTGESYGLYWLVAIGLGGMFGMVV